jgi:hypothetical protein
LSCRSPSAETLAYSISMVQDDSGADLFRRVRGNARLMQRMQVFGLE